MTTQTKLEKAREWLEEDKRRSDNGHLAAAPEIIRNLLREKELDEQEPVAHMREEKHGEAWIAFQMAYPVTLTPSMGGNARRMSRYRRIREASK